MQELPIRKHLPHDIPNWVPDDAIFFITVNCLIRGKHQLNNAPIADLLFESVQHRQQAGIWYVHLMILMPDHIHALMSFPRETSMRSVLFKWKEFAAKKSGIRWQRDFFDHRLRRDESYEEKAHYIRMNPVRKQLVTSPEDWPYVWNPPLPSMRA